MGNSSFIFVIFPPHIDSRSLVETAALGHWNHILLLGNNVALHAVQHLMAGNFSKREYYSKHKTLLGHNVNEIEIRLLYCTDKIGVK